MLLSAMGIKGAPLTAAEHAYVADVYEQCLRRIVREMDQLARCGSHGRRLIVRIDVLGDFMCDPLAAGELTTLLEVAPPNALDELTSPSHILRRLAEARVSQDGSSERTALAFAHKCLQRWSLDGRWLFHGQGVAMLLAPPLDAEDAQEPTELWSRLDTVDAYEAGLTIRTASEPITCPPAAGGNELAKLERAVGSAECALQQRASTDEEASTAATDLVESRRARVQAEAAWLDSLLPVVERDTHLSQLVGRTSDAESRLQRRLGGSKRRAEGIQEAIDRLTMAAEALRKWLVSPNVRGGKESSERQGRAVLAKSNPGEA